MDTHMTLPVSSPRADAYNRDVYFIAVENVSFKASLTLLKSGFLEADVAVSFHVLTYSAATDSNVGGRRITCCRITIT